MVTVLVLTKKYSCDLYIFEMVAFNANKNERNLNKNLLNVLPSKKKKKPKTTFFCLKKVYLVD